LDMELVLYHSVVSDTLLLEVRGQGTKHLRVFSLFLGAFAKLRKATISIVMSVCLSVRMEKTRSFSMDFHEYFSKISRKFEFHYNLPTITATLQADRHTV